MLATPANKINNFLEVVKLNAKFWGQRENSSQKTMQGKTGE